MKTIAEARLSFYVRIHIHSYNASMIPKLHCLQSCTRCLPTSILVLNCDDAHNQRERERERERTKPPKPKTPPQNLIPSPPPNLKLQTHPPPSAPTLISTRLKNLPHDLCLFIPAPAPQIPPLRLQSTVDGRHDLVAQHGEEFKGVPAAACGED